MSSPGWFPDPGGVPNLYRYWDGQAWTDQFTSQPGGPPPAAPGQGQPGGPPPAAPGQGQPPGAAPPKRSGRGWLIALIAIAVAVVVVVALAVRGLSGGAWAVCHRVTGWQPVVRRLSPARGRQQSHPAAQ